MVWRVGWEGNEEGKEIYFSWLLAFGLSFSVLAAFLIERFLLLYVNCLWCLVSAWHLASAHQAYICA